MAFADCSKIHNLPADELSLCITTPPSERPISQDYLWTTLTRHGAIAACGGLRRSDA